MIMQTGEIEHEGAGEHSQKDINKAIFETMAALAGNIDQVRGEIIGQWKSIEKMAKELDDSTDRIYELEREIGEMKKEGLFE